VSQQLGALQTHITDTFLFISHTTNVLLFKFRCNIFNAGFGSVWDTLYYTLMLELILYYVLCSSALNLYLTFYIVTFITHLQENYTNFLT